MRAARLALGLAAGALLLGACGLPGFTTAPGHAEAAAVALEYLHAVGRGDAATMCALMSRDYRSSGFEGDGVSDSAPCLVKAKAVAETQTDEGRAEFLAAGLVGVDDGNGGRVLVRTTGPNAMTVEVITEGVGPKVDDAYLT